MPRNRLTLLWLAFAVLVSCNSGSPLASRKLGAVTIVPNRTTVNVTEAVAVSDGTNLATVTAGGALNVTSSPGGTSPSFSAQLATVSGAVKASAGTLYSFHCVNRNAANRYLQLFNSAAGPGGGASALDEFIEPGGSGMIVIGTDFFTSSGQSFSTGIAFGNSTTSGTYTAATAADHDCSFLYQ